MIKKYKISFMLSPLVLSLMTLNAQALPDSSQLAHTTYIIKPGVRNTSPSGLSPVMVRKAYGFADITNQGEGQTIALVDAFDDPNIEADLQVFDTTFNLDECTTANGCFTKIYAAGTQPKKNAGWAGEMSLDVEWAHAIAPKAKLILVEAANQSMSALMTAVDVAVKNGANVVSMSWGIPETKNETTYDAVFNNPSVTFTASSGDSGHNRGGMIYPSASPYVISVGGTTLTTDNDGTYISETAWGSAHSIQYGGSGGGFSAYEQEPAYQSDFHIPNNTNNMRGTPDVSYDADPNSGFSVYDSIPEQGQKGWLVFGGTSAGAPQWAALIAIVNSAGGKNISDTHSALYTLAKTDYATMYHDIASGVNGTCGNLCTATAGYDYVTGIGSPQGNSLINSLSSNNMYHRMAS